MVKKSPSKDCYLNRSRVILKGLTGLDEDLNNEWAMAISTFLEAFETAVKSSHVEIQGPYFRSLLLDTSKLSESVFSCNKYIIPGDGNCLYRTISMNVFGNQTWWRQIKLYCILGTLENFESERELVTETLPSSNNTIDKFDYLMEFLREGAWGSLIELRSISRLLPIRMWNCNGPNLNFGRDDYNIWYNGVHFEPLSLTSELQLEIYPHSHISQLKHFHPVYLSLNSATVLENVPKFLRPHVVDTDEQFRSLVHQLNSDSPRNLSSVITLRECLVVLVNHPNRMLFEKASDLIAAVKQSGKDFAVNIVIDSLCIFNKWDMWNFIDYLSQINNQLLIRLFIKDSDYVDTMIERSKELPGFFEGCCLIYESDNSTVKPSEHSINSSLCEGILKRIVGCHREIRTINTNKGVIQSLEHLRSLNDSIAKPEALAEGSHSDDSNIDVPLSRPPLHEDRKKKRIKQKTTSGRKRALAKERRRILTTGSEPSGEIVATTNLVHQKPEVDSASMGKGLSWADECELDLQAKDERSNIEDLTSDSGGTLCNDPPAESLSYDSGEEGGTNCDDELSHPVRRLIHYLDDKLDIMSVIVRDNESTCDPRKMAQVVNDTMHIRHDLLGEWVCEQLNLTNRGDTNVLSFLQSHLAIKGDTRSTLELKQSLNLMGEDLRHSVTKRTPDYVGIVSFDDEVVVEDSEGHVLLVIDFTVSKMGQKAELLKREKYQIYENILPSGYKFLNVAVCYHLVDRQLRSDPGLLDGLDLPNCIEERLIRSNDIIAEITRMFGSQQAYNEAINSDFISGQESWSKKLDFSITVEEFNNLEESCILEEILTENNDLAKHNIKDMFWDLMRFMNDDPGCSHDYGPMESNIINTAEKHIIDQTAKESVIFKPPDNIAIASALDDFKSDCRSYYNIQASPKIISHFPLVYPGTMLTDTVKLEATPKIAILKKFSMALAGVHEKDMVVESLSNLMQYHKLDSDKIKKLEKEKLVVHQDGSITSLMMAAEVRRESKSIPGSDGLSILGPHNTLYCPKKSEKEYKSLLYEVRQGIGKRNTAQTKYKEKIKSLQFWDDSTRAELVDQYTSIRDDFVEGLESLGKKSERVKYSQSVDFADTLEVETGAISYCRQADSFYENLVFCSTFASNGHRLVTCLNPNILGFLFPSDSITKSKTRKPYLILAFVPFGYTFKTLGQTWKKFHTDGGMLYISFGKNDTNKTMSPRVHHTERFISTYGCVSHLLHSSCKVPPSKRALFELVGDCMSLTTNININNSSFLDNLRYLAINVMADYSAAPMYIKDKLFVPCKNLFQVYLTDKTFQMLTRLNDESRTIKYSEGGVDEDGNLVMDSIKVIDAEISSLLCPSSKYSNPIALMYEIITYYFSTTKGLHDPVHNTKAVHRTPIEIQMKTDRDKKPGLKYDAMCVDSPIKRHQFNPYVVTAANLLAQMECTMSPSMMRNDIFKKSGVQDSILTIKTMTSTRSCIRLVPRKVEASSQVGPAGYMKHVLKGDEKDVEATMKLHSDLLSTLRARKKISWKRMIVRRIKSGYLRERKSNNRDLLMDLLGVTYDPPSIRIKGGPDHSIYSEGFCKDDEYMALSTPVLSKVLEDVKESYEVGKEITVGAKGRECIMNGDKVLFAVRKKGQRTKNDREIYVFNTPAKYMLYNLEHTYKQACHSHPNERISERGDLKILSLKQQTDDMIRWARDSYKNNFQKGANMSILNLNLDMTKWSPKDNTLKYLFIVASNKSLMLEEKLYLCCVLIRHYNKMMFMDYSMLNSCDKSDSQLTDEEIDHKCVFKEASKGFTTAMFPIKENWLQGQLNYISSYLHAGGMALWKRCLLKSIGEGLSKIQINVHSDDNQTSIGLYHTWSMDDLVNCSIRTLNSVLHLMTFELSDKKCYISRCIKEFVSQYNIGGEQLYPWVKPVMSMVSGTPYTTLKDDISSALSKASEAICKGGPGSLCRNLCEEVCDGIRRVYGVSGHTSGNVFSNTLRVRDGWLPMSLGNSFICSDPVLGVCGPRSADKMVLMDILQGMGATSQSPPTSLIGASNEMLSALSIFSFMDMFSKVVETLEDDGYEATSLNPFKPVKFKVRELSGKDPFRFLDQEERGSIIKSFLKERPTAMITKPKIPEHIIRYYLTLYSEPSFKSSLTGQSPDALMLHKVMNKNSLGAFAFRSDVSPLPHENINLNDIEDRLQKTHTAQSLAEFFKIYILNNPATLSTAKHLWSTYIEPDIEFRSAYLSVELGTISGSVQAPNLVPIRPKRDLDERCMANHMSDLLTYLFDYRWFKQEKRSLQFPGLASHDMIYLIEHSPDIFVALLHLQRINPPEYLGFEKLLMDAQRLAKNSLKLHDKFGNISNSSKPIVRTLISQFFPELTLKEDDYQVHTKEGVRPMTYQERAKKVRDQRDQYLMLPNFTKDGVMLPLQQYHYAGEWFKQLGIKENTDDLARFIRRRCALGGGFSDRIFFLPAGSGNDVMSITLGIRSALSIRGGVMNVYLLDESRGKLKCPKAFHRITDRKDFESASSVFSNYWTILALTGSSKAQATASMLSAKVHNLSFDKVASSLSKISKASRLRLIVPSLICYPDKQPMLLSSMNCDYVHWKKPQSHSNDSFCLVVTNFDHHITIEGYADKITKIVVTVSQAQPKMRALAESLGMAYGDIKLKKRVNLLGVLPGAFEYSPERSVAVRRMLSVHPGLLRFEVVEDGREPAEGFFLIVGSAVRWKKHSSELPVLEHKPELKYVNLFTVCAKFSNGETQEYNHRDNPKKLFEGLILPNKLLSGDLSIENIITYSSAEKILNYQFSSLSPYNIISMAKSDGVVCKRVGGYISQSLLGCFYGECRYSDVRDIILSDMNGPRTLTNDDSTWAERFSGLIEGLKAPKESSVTISFQEATRGMRFMNTGPTKIGTRANPKYIGAVNIDFLMRSCSIPVYSRALISCGVNMVGGMIVVLNKHTEPGRLYSIRKSPSFVRHALEEFLLIHSLDVLGFIEEFFCSAYDQGAMREAMKDAAKDCSPPSNRLEKLVVSLEMNMPELQEVRSIRDMAKRRLAGKVVVVPETDREMHISLTNSRSSSPTATRTDSNSAKSDLLSIVINPDELEEQSDSDGYGYDGDDFMD